MSKGGDQGTQTSTTKQEPWSGQIPYLSGGFSEAGRLYNQGGPQYYPGQTNAGPADQQLQGIAKQASLGANGSPISSAANQSVTGMFDPSYLTANPGNAAFAQAANGGLGVNTSGFYAPIASGQVGNTAGQGDLSQIASGQAGSNLPGTDTLQKFASGGMLSADNPYFQQMANKISASVLPQIASQFANGNRLDSGLATRAQAEGLGDSIGSLAYQNYQQGLGQQQSAASDLAQLGQGNVAQRSNAAGMLGQLGQGNISNMLQAANGLTQTGLGNAGNVLQGAQGLSGNFNNATQRQLTGAALAPQLQNMNYNDALQLQNAGMSLQGLNQSAIDDALQRYNYGQQLPYQNLQNYMNQINGSYGGTSTLTQPYAKNTAGNVLSGALGGGALGSALVGADAVPMLAPMMSAGGFEGLSALLGAGLAFI